MTEHERIENLKHLGYNNREAAFVALAALHSGYFVRRQYCSFISAGKGWVDEALTAKLLRFGHAREVVLRSRRRLYSISSKQIFAALGEEDNRNRRRHEPQTIKARLMGLEYVISRPDVRWFPTETDRVSLFTDELGVSREFLPTWRYSSKNGQRTTLRWFVDKPPVFLASSDSAVHFCFVDPGFHTSDTFASFLRNYRPLFSRLPRFVVLYLASNRGASDVGRRVFERFFSLAGSSPEDPLAAELLEYYRDRSEHEKSGLGAFNQERLDLYRESRKQFANTRYEGLYEVWKQQGETVLRREMSPESRPDINGRGQFVAQVCPQHFDLLGSVLRDESGEHRQNKTVYSGFGGGF
jgi:hypothetical protein